MNTASQLWSKLADAGQTIGDFPEATGDTAPWYVRLMLGFAGLIAAAFLLGFIGAAFAFIVKSNVAAVITGVLIIAGAYFLFIAFKRSDFGTMFALAASIAGQCMLLFGLLQILNASSSDPAPWITVALIESMLALLMPNFVHRVLSACCAGFAFAYAMSLSGAGNLSAGIVAAITACLWLNELSLARYHSCVSPIAYGLSIVLVEIEGANLFSHSMGAIFGVRQMQLVSAIVGEALMVAVLLLSVWILLRRARWDSARALPVLAATTLIAAASFKAPGIACGLLLALLGHAHGNRLLAGFGVAALLFYISGYYYVLSETLLFKSGVLLATGVILLTVRWLVLNHLMPKETADA